MMNRCWNYLIAIIIVSILGMAQAVAATIPSHPDGYVNDYAHLLTLEQAQQLTNYLRDFDHKTSDQVVVATFNSLGGEPIEDFSIKLADKWKIGTKQKDNGIILLIAKNDHQMRIEVGYGLEGALPDALAGIIIRHDIAPYFKKKEYYQGIDNGIVAITQSIQGEYTVPISSQTTNPTTNQSDDSPLNPLIILVVLLLILYAVISVIGNGIISLVHLLTKNKVTTTNRWFGSHGFFRLTLFGLFLFFIFSGSGSGNSGGGFGGGGFGGGGGFSGGGGGFGGGGASGGW